MTEPAVLYAEGRQRLTRLLVDLPDGQAETAVPACPEWTVRNVAAHLAGVCADILAGRIEGVATERWTAAQVDARRDHSLAQILEEWSETAPQVEAMAEHFPGRVGVQWMFDMTTHEHDIRGALRARGARDSEAVRQGVDLVVRIGLDPNLRARGLGPIEIATESQSWLVGGADPSAVAGGAEAVSSQLLLSGDDLPEPSGPPVGKLSISDFELLRALTGRRSPAQVAHYDWDLGDGDPAPYAKAFPFGPFSPRGDDLHE